MKKHSSSLEQRESVKGAKSVRRDSREVMAELVAQLRKQLDAESVVAADKIRVCLMERARIWIV